MGLTNKKEEQLRSMPQIKTQVFKSKNGKLCVHKTTITDIKPVAYYETVFKSEKAEDVTDDLADLKEEFVV